MRFFWESMFAIREGAADLMPRRPRTIARRVPTDPEPGPAPAPASGDPGGGQPTEASAPARPRILRNTAIFSIATGLSRIAGLVREIVAAGLFGTSVQASAFTIAFQVPNLLRALVADAALSAAFVPVFTELLEEGRKRDAYALAGALFGLILAALGVITV